MSDASTNPLTTDMVAPRVMGFLPSEIPTFTTAIAAGMHPASLDVIEIRGAAIADVERPFARPNMLEWKAIRPVWAAREI